MKKLTDKNKVVLLVILITVLQIALRFYVGTSKSYFHMDEMYSYGLMNYDKLNITDNADFLNNWHDKEYYLDYLEVNDYEVWNLKPVYENQKNDCHPPLYYFLLRIASTFSINHFSKWTGIILNIIIFAISSVFVYKISKIIFRNPLYSILMCFINGFSFVSINSSMYIRMYELCNMLILGTTYFHMKIWRAKELTLKSLLPVGIFLILGGLTHYYFFIYAFALYALYVFKCIKHKKYKNLLRYNLAIILSAAIYLLIFPYSIEHVFFGYRGIQNGSDATFIDKAKTYLSIINKDFFNYILILVFIVIAVLCCKKRKTKIRLNSYIYMFIVPIILYLIMVIKNSPYTEIRYIIPIYSVTLILVFYLIKKYFLEHIKNKETLFLLILMFLIVLYSPLIFNTQIEFTYSQYDSIVQKIENEDLPIVYVFNPGQNRFLDDLYLFTLVDKSIVIDSNNQEKIDEIFSSEQTFILICNGSVDEDYIKNTYTGNYEYLQRMNACNIYKVSLDTVKE